MEVKTFEIRDSATFIPVLAVRLGSDIEADRFLLGRAGYGLTRTNHEKYIVLCRFDGGVGHSTSDPHQWGGDRTMMEAHRYIREHWQQLPTGSVVDVQFILGETSAPKESEALTCAY